MRPALVVVLACATVGCKGGSVVKPPDPPPQGPPRFDVTWVREAADLETLAFAGDEEAVAQLRTSMGEAVSDSDFGVFTDTAAATEGLPTLAGTPVVAVLRLDDDADGPSCSTMTAFGQSSDGFRVSTEGVCGGISILHSLIELGLTTAADASADGKFKEKAMDDAQGDNKRSMTKAQLRARHEGFGATQCRELGQGDGFFTGNQGVLERFLRDLDAIEDERPPWDCTLSVYTEGPDRRPTLAHFEHIEAVTRNADGTTTITTTNGLAQGNGTTTVPAAPGSNTWTCRPGAARGTHPMELTGSTHADADRYRRALPPVNNVSALCCRPPPPS